MAKLKSMKVMKSMKATTKVIYSRTSSKSNVNGSTHQRQAQAVASCLSKKDQKDLEKVTECISGTLPLDQRGKLLSLLNGSYKDIYVESLRALARKSSVLEEVHEQAKKTGTSIHVADAGGSDLFKGNGSPAQHFQRRVLSAVTEYERDMIVERLQKGLATRKAQLQTSSSSDSVKINGRKSYLEKWMENNKGKKSYKKTLAKLRQLCKNQQNGKLSLRSLAEGASKILKLKPAMNKDAAITLARNLGIKD